MSSSRIVWLVLFFASLHALPSTAIAQSPPNIVFILADDMGYGDLGCYGAKGGHTPHLDRMAKEGIRFTDFYAAQGVCSASRASLLTGCYPNRIGILGALGPTSTVGISDREKTIAEVLKTRGYATAIFGKWHLGHQVKHLPTQHGFDEYLGLPYSNDMLPSHPKANGKYPPLPLIEGNNTIETNPDQSQLTTRYTERAVAFIEKNKHRPFFLYLPHAMPHVPLHVSDRHKGKSKLGLYGDVIMELDWSVGQVLETLKKHNLDSNTLVMFSSDNGPSLSCGKHAGSAGPLREGKSTVWEGGVRVPFIARWPGRIPAGTVQREPTMTIDVLPTLASITQARLPEHKIDGQNIWPLLIGQKEAGSSREALYFYLGKELQAVRSGKWKLHLPHRYRTLAGKKGGTYGSPTTMEVVATPLALYDLEKDPGEKQNVAATNMAVVQRLQGFAETARCDLGDSGMNIKGIGAREPEVDSSDSSFLLNEESETFTSLLLGLFVMSLAVCAKLGLVTILFVTRNKGRKARQPVVDLAYRSSSEEICASGMVH